jgi:ribosomal subunit interface protein
MQTPLEIRFHQMEPSPSIEERIRAKAAELERFSDQITSCRVVVEKDHRQHRKGNLFRVRIDLAVPGKEIVANRKGPKDHAHEDIQVAIRDAFNALARQLEDHVRARRGKTKIHEVPPHGQIKMLDPSGDFGFITMPDGQEVYFHRNSLANGTFDQLAVGDEVRVVIAEGEGVEGAQASTVQPIGKHHVQDPRP